MQISFYSQLLLNQLFFIDNDNNFMDAYEPLTLEEKETPTVYLLLMAEKSVIAAGAVEGRDYDN